MQVKHTPGPWCAIEYAGYHEIQSEPFYGYSNLLDEEGCPEAPHNAKLAAAAPDLLEALQEYVNACAGPVEAHTKALAAIEKALPPKPC